MSKKIYHIVDPETGKVVGMKKVGRLGQEYYEASPKEKRKSRLLCIDLLLMLLIILLVLFLFLAPEEKRMYIAYAFLAVCVMQQVLTRIYNHIDKKSEDNDEQSNENHRD